jgi:hypothetical protein
VDAPNRPRALPASPEPALAKIAALYSVPPPARACNRCSGDHVHKPGPDCSLSVTVGELIEQRDGQPPSYIVDRLVLDLGLAALIGRSKAKKSFLKKLLGLCVASGEPFLGFDTQQGTVLDIDEENSPELAAEQLANMIRAVPAFADPDVLRSYRICSMKGLRLYGPGLERLRREIDNFGPMLTFLDAYRRISGSDENSSKEVSADMEKMNRIREEFGTAILFLHHSSEEISKGPNWEDQARGSTDFFAAVDSMMGLRKTGSLTGWLRASTRAGDVEPFDLAFDSVTNIFSRAIVPASVPEEKPSTTRGRRSKTDKDRDRLLDLIRQKPGLSRRLLRKEMKIQSNRLGDLLKQLDDGGEAENRDDGWYPVGVPEPEAQP